ncbi:aminotransferase class I/II-fold pyridoxal phosphate-dependent enzyme [Pedobacter aquatilis]|uniref:aminotransferase class I/II-fold pyridoxal phosphate-dependent enzyme n=1 Tax=Pedobacter aquatilis TaxID=351343 RepID=UPI0025B3EB9B|nr:aminotransferase class I/II-fold pyridoxal phosphate-dependent enzyme [Pedobacter aquatilis]MDN3586593.1 aminotransferase class I/II-fold pyridoxal phosphate-dependent enzyme [Pedobacter aquatilis]
MKLDFKEIDQPFASTINFSGKEYLYFGGTAYLGIPQNDDFIKLYIDGIKKFGLNNGTSRSNNIQLGIYNEAENEAAKRCNAEAALVTSSGYLAAQLAVKELSNFGSVIYAPSTHPALWLVQQTNISQNFTSWSNDVIKTVNSDKEKNWVLISNSMNNLHPEIYDFNFLEQIDNHKNIILIVDDSHGIGINNNGYGAYVKLPKRSNIESVVVASMAKALGVDAGVILGSKKIIEQLKSTNTFIGASPPSAAGLFAFANGEEIYKNELKKLNENITLFEESVDSNCSFEPNFPAFLFNDSALADKLLKKQILISSFPYPGTNNTSINRVIISSWHTEEQIQKLITVLA